MALGDGMANPWTGVPGGPGDEGAHHANLMNQIMAPQAALQGPQKKNDTFGWLTMRAVEKDPLLATIAGKKWTPVDTWGQGMQQQTWNTPKQDAGIQAPWGSGYQR